MMNNLLFFFPIFFFLVIKFFKRDSIPEEGQGCTKSLPKQRGHQLLISKPSPRPTRSHHSSSMQTASLLSHHTDSDSDNSDEVEKGKLMKPKQQKKTFSLGDSDDDEEQSGLQMKRT